MIRSVKDNSGLDGALVLDALERLAVLLKPERLVHDSLGLDLAAVKVVDRLGCQGELASAAKEGASREKHTKHVHLGEGADDADLVPKDLGGGPADAGGVGVDAVHDERAAAAAVVDGILKDLDRAGGLDDDVEPVRVVLLDLLVLRARVGP